MNGNTPPKKRTLLQTLAGLFQDVADGARGAREYGGGQNVRQVGRGGGRVRLGGGSGCNKPCG